MARFYMRSKSPKKLPETGQEAARDLPKGVKLIRTLEGHDGPIGRIAWSPDGRMLASPSGDGTVRLWDVESGQCLQILEDHRGPADVAVFHPSGKILASGGGTGTEDFSIRLWDVASGKVLHVFGDHADSISGLVFGQHGRKLASGSYDGPVCLWDLGSIKRIWKIGDPLEIAPLERDVLYGLAFDPSGQRLFSGGEISGVRV